MSPCELAPALNAAECVGDVAPSAMSATLPATVHAETVPTVSNGPLSKSPLPNGNVDGVGVATGVAVGVGVGVPVGVGVGVGLGLDNCVMTTVSTTWSAVWLPNPTLVKRRVVVALSAMKVNW